MSLLEIAYFNFEHGGRSDAGYCGDGGPCDYTGLVEVASDPWPDILVMGEADRYEMHGGRAGWGAAAAMRDAGGPAYTYLQGTMDDGRMFAPCLFVNTATVQIHNWYDSRLPDHAGRLDNLLRFTAPGSDRELRLVTGHGNIHSGDARLAQARTSDRFANPTVPTMMLQDFNSTLSGPGWAPPAGEYDDETRYKPWARTHRVQFEHGAAQAGPYREDTRALDAMCGWWNPELGQRVGGMGWYDVADLHANCTPTVNPHVPGRWRKTVDRILVNGSMRDLMVEGSYRVHEHPDTSDHNRVSVAIQI